MLHFCYIVSLHSRTKRVYVDVPESLYVQLKQRVENSNGRYVSISEVVREAVWGFLKNNEVHEWAGFSS